LAGMRFLDSFLFAGIGFGAQVFREVLIANRKFRSFWPITKQRWGIGMSKYISGL